MTLHEARREAFLLLSLRIQARERWREAIAGARAALLPAPVVPVALNKVRVLLSPSWFRMPSATSLDARETMCNVEVSTEIYVQQEPRELSYSNIVFVTSLHFNKLKTSFGTEGEEGNNMVSNASYMSSFYIQLLPFCFAIFFSF